MTAPTIETLAERDSWISPAYALAHAAPEFWDSLSPEEQLVAAYDLDIWLRPEQRIPEGRFLSCTWLAGRGFGKTVAIAYQINRLVEQGRAKHLLLGAPTDARVTQVQVAYLVGLSPPWFQAEQYDEKCVRWPNGAMALGFSPEAPGRVRSENVDIAWTTELLDWNQNNAIALHNNIRTATRTPGAFMLSDTTSQGCNDLIKRVLDEHAQDPRLHRLIRGTMLDNFALERDYIGDQFLQYRPGTQEHAEEILGETFTGAAGAAWNTTTIAAMRVAFPPATPELTVVSIDPALSKHRTADAVGYMRGSRDKRGHIYLEADRSAQMSPEEWASMALDDYERGAAGAIIERNHVGDFPHVLIRVLARERGIHVEVLDHKSEQPFPPRKQGVFYVREVVSEQSKATRHASAASLASTHRAHLCGTFRDLEREMVNWTPGQRSPNRLDAYSQMLIELGDLRAIEHARDERAAAGAIAANKAIQGMIASGRSAFGLSRRGVGL